MEGIFAIDTNSSLENAVRLTKSFNFNYIPIYDGNVCNIIDLLSLSPWYVTELDLQNDKLSKVIQPALFVTENQYLEELFHLFDKLACHTAIAVDEFGTCIGMINKQDLYEEAVGDLEEQTRRRYRTHMMCQKLSEDSMLIDAKLPISQVNEILGTQINSRDYFLLGGLMLAHLHHLPSMSEHFEDYGYRFTSHANEQALKIKILKRTMPY